MQNEEAFSETEVLLSNFGGKEYTLYFGLQTMRRIKEEQPEFTIVEPNMSLDEVPAFLIRCAIGPKGNWKDTEEYLEIYDNFARNKANEKVLQHVLLAYQNAIGFTERVYMPVVVRLKQYVTEMQAELEVVEAKATAEVHQKQEEEQAPKEEKVE
jgi:hypothetical protein